MIWIPILSIIVFALIFVPTIIYGFKKGWKGALMISVLLFTFNFIMIGIGYLIYNQIWSAYRVVFFDRQVKNGFSFDHDVLKDVYKYRIILLFSFLCMPITYLATWIIQYSFSRLLTKHWAHRTKQVSNSEKQIIVRVNSHKSKLIGGVILFANSIFWVSYTTSAVNVMTTPWNKKNVFNNATDWLSKIYGGGQAFNDSAPFAVEKFLKGADYDLATGLRSLIKVFSADSIKSIDNQLTKKASIIKNKNALISIEKESPRATDIIIKAILALTKNEVNPLMYDQDIYRATEDEFGNQLGYHGGNSRGLFINQLKEYLNDHPLEINFSQQLQDIYVEEFEKRISSWKSLIFNQNINNAIEKKESAKKILKTFINQRDEQIKAKAIAIANREEKIDKLAKIFSKDWVVKHLVKTPVLKTVENTVEWAKYTYDFGQIDDSSFTYNKGLLEEITPTNINQELKKLNNNFNEKNVAERMYKEAKKSRGDKDSEFIDIAVGGRNLNWESAQNYRQTLNAEFDQAKDIYNQAVTSRKNKEEDWDRNDVKIPKLAVQLRDFNDQLENLETVITEATNELNKLKDEKDQAEKNYTAAENDLRIKTNKVKTTKAKLVELDNIIASKQDDLNDYDQKNPGVTNEDARWKSLNNSLQQAKDKWNNYNQNENSIAINEQILAVNSKFQMTSKKDAANKNFDIKKRKWMKLKSDQSVLQNRKMEIKSQYDSSIQENNLLKGDGFGSILQDETKEKDKKKSWDEIGRKKQIFEDRYNIQKSIRDKLVKKENSTQTNWNTKTNIYNEQKNKIENIKANAIKIINEDTIESNKQILAIDDKIAIKNDETIKNRKEKLLSSHPSHNLQKLFSKDGDPINGLADLVQTNLKIRESIGYQNLVISVWNKRIETLQNIAKKIKVNYDHKKQELITIFKEWIKT